MDFTVKVKKERGKGRVSFTGTSKHKIFNVDYASIEKGKNFNEPQRVKMSYFEPNKLQLQEVLIYFCI